MLAALTRRSLGSARGMSHQQIECPKRNTLDKTTQGLGDHSKIWKAGQVSQGPRCLTRSNLAGLPHPTAVLSSTIASLASTPVAHGLGMNEPSGFEGAVVCERMYLFQRIDGIRLYAMYLP